jgi:hypothetical protein
MATPSPSTVTVTAFTRHTDHSKYKDTPQWKGCNCRNSVYLYEDGRAKYISAPARGWDRP